MMVDFATAALISIPIGLTLSASATIASLMDWERRFKTPPYSEFKNEYRVPYFMMVLCGFGIAPFVGIFFGAYSWVVFFRRADLVK